MGQSPEHNLLKKLVNFAILSPEANKFRISLGDDSGRTVRWVGKSCVNKDTDSRISIGSQNIASQESIIVKSFVATS